MKKWKSLPKKIKVVFAIIAVIGGITGIYLYNAYQEAHALFKRQIVVEYKEEFDYHKAINNIPEKSIDEVEYEGEVDTNTLGKYPVTYQYGGNNYQVEVEVKDTIQPSFTLKEGSVRQNGNFDPSQFVENIEDATKVNFNFVENYQFNEIKDYTVQIEGIDECGNSSIEETIIHVLEPDLVPPALSGLSDLNVGLHAAVNYHTGVSVYDDTDINPTYEIDASEVKLDTPGNYTIQYTAYDIYGNKATYPRKITVNNIPTQTNKVVYLTFDDGPSKNTSKLLAILDRYHIKATFFVTASWPQYVQYLRSENDAGHTIALHTYSHVYERIYASKEAYIEDFKMIQNYVKAQLGYYPTIFRFPGGSSNHVSMKYCEGVVSELVEWANENNLTYVDWNVISGDGDVRTSTADMIKTIEKSPLHDQIMLLCHDSGAAKYTVEALPTIIEYYQARGYVFRPITDLTPEFHHTVAN